MSATCKNFFWFGIEFFNSTKSFQTNTQRQVIENNTSTGRGNMHNHASEEPVVIDCSYVHEKKSICTR